MGSPDQRLCRVKASRQQCTNTSLYGFLPMRVLRMVKRSLVQPLRLEGFGGDPSRKSTINREELCLRMHVHTCVGGAVLVNGQSVMRIQQRFQEFFFLGSEHKLAVTSVDDVNSSSWWN
jgi:hypothetical protein